MNTPEDFEEQLDSFDPADRADALNSLIAAHLPCESRPGTNVNMHFHSFFSYNAQDWSPSHIAWKAKSAGLYAAGLCDFDVLDGLDEFLEAGRKLALRVSVNLETRAFFTEYSNAEISSPGEPGVGYVMGAGFAEMPAVGTPEALGLAGYRNRARERNIALIERINPHVPIIAVDYERDVLPLTPQGVATERHIIAAYVDRSHEVFQHPDATVKFWAELLSLEFEEMVELMADRAALEEAVRKKLAKRGGVGYEQPSPSTFPPVGEFMQWVASCKAIPMATWLDGTSAGEADGRAMLEYMQSKGAAALNIIPDRNWNVSDPDEGAVKLRNLNDIVAAANDMHLPINIGTEMNKAGLPFTDALDCPALQPHKRSFLKGARIMVGHTMLLKYAGMSYIGEHAAAEFPDVSTRNDFFESVGAMPALTETRAKQLEDMGEKKALAWLRAEAVELRHLHAIDLD